MSFRRYAAEKIVAAIVVLWLAASMVFVVFWVLPADPARQVAGKGASEAAVERVRHDLHLDDPLYDQYGFFLRSLAHGSLGHSYYNGESVNVIVGAAAPVTGSLAAWTLLWSVLIGVPLGLVWHRRSRWVGVQRLRSCTWPLASHRSGWD